MEIRVRYLGSFGVWLWINFLPTYALIPGVITWQEYYGFLILAALLTGGLTYVLKTHTDVFQSHPKVIFAAKVISALLASAGTLCISALMANPSLPAWIAHVGLAFGCLGIGSQMIRWVVLYSSFNVKQVTSAVFAVGLIAALTELIMVVLPLPVALGIIATSPLFSELTLDTCQADPQFAPPSGAGEHSPYRLGGMWRVWLVVFGVPVILGVMVGECFEDFGVLTTGQTLLEMAITVLADIAVLLWVSRSRTFTSFVTLWKAIMVVLGVLLFVAMVSPGGVAVQLAVNFAATTTANFFLVTLCDILHRAQIEERSIYTVASLLVFGYHAFLVATTFAIRYLFPNASLQSLAAGMFLLLVVLAASSWGTSDFAMRSIFEDVNPVDETLPEASTPEVICESLAAKYNLTPREAEVLDLLLRGRTRAYIAETLFISEDTAKSHTSHIYEKTGVHSRKELQSLAHTER